MSTQPTPTAARAARQLRALMTNHDPRRTSRDLGDLLGISQQSASRRMTGETPLNVEELFQVAAWFDTPLTHFTGEPQPATP